ncbi:hypothetical protein M378DRAFT_213571 [Amanita muscaria Koide BX008]|uniref:Uncharacterized protein n=1 Tax=Amanita muscaria (strain Koide BX008) TaxID=946122 RepID=A0A0C2XAC3_AMAMK|nr:hypothetical protein M378DRAFT_213571 [Amanita muscaria Koide BX008]
MVNPLYMLVAMEERPKKNATQMLWRSFGFHTYIPSRRSSALSVSCPIRLPTMPARFCDNCENVHLAQRGICNAGFSNRLIDPKLKVCVRCILLLLTRVWLNFLLACGVIVFNNFPTCGVYKLATNVQGYATSPSMGQPALNHTSDR